MQTLKELFEQYNYIQQEIRKQKSMLDLTKSELCRLAKFQYGDKVNIIKGPWQRGFVGYGCVQDIKITPLKMQCACLSLNAVQNCLKKGKIKK